MHTMGIGVNLAVARGARKRRRHIPAACGRGVPLRPGRAVAAEACRCGRGVPLRPARAVWGRAATSATPADPRPRSAFHPPGRTGPEPLPRGRSRTISSNGDPSTPAPSDAILAGRIPASGHIYYATDANFNVTALIDAATGQVIERYSYESYGKRTVLNGAAGADSDVDGQTVLEWSPDPDNASDVGNLLGFTGARLDMPTGLVLMRNRYTHPSLGRFTSNDLEGHIDGLSVYQYCGSGPAGATDATGLASTTQPSQPTTQPATQPVPSQSQTELLELGLNLLKATEELNTMLKSGQALAKPNAGLEIEKLPRRKPIKQLNRSFLTIPAIRLRGALLALGTYL
jgi:RHS repeat-associated protein